MPSVFSRCFPGVSSRPRLRSRSSSRKRRFRREGRVSSRVSGFRCLLRPLPRSTCSPGLVLQRRSWDSAGARSRRPEREEAPGQAGGWLAASRPHRRPAHPMPACLRGWRLTRAARKGRALVAMREGGRRRAWLRGEPASRDHCRAGRS